MALETPKLWSLESPHLYRYVVELSADGVVVDRVESNFGVRTIKFDPDQGFLLNGQRSPRARASIRITPGSAWPYRIRCSNGVCGS